MRAVVVPLDEVGGYAPGAQEAVVYTWRVVPVAAGGHRADDVKSQFVRL